MNLLQRHLPYLFFLSILSYFFVASIVIIRTILAYVRRERYLILIIKTSKDGGKS